MNRINSKQSHLYILALIASMLSAPIAHAMDTTQPAPAPAAEEDAGIDLGPLFALAMKAGSGFANGAVKVINAGTEGAVKLGNIGKEFVNERLKAAQEAHEKQQLLLQSNLNKCNDRISKLAADLARQNITPEYKAQLEKQLLSAESEKVRIEKQITSSQDAHDKLVGKLTESMGEFGKQVAQGVREGMNQIVGGFVPNVTTIAAERAKAQENNRSKMELIKIIKNPALLSLITCAVVGTFYGLKFSYQVIEDWYKVPELADKSTLVSPLTKFWRVLTDTDVFNTTLDDVVLNPELTTKFRNYVAATKNIIENGGHLRHLLLPGPPGTGKTTIGFALAGELGIDAIYFNAGKLRNCTLEIALRRLDQLFKKAENAEKPILIIIDEAELVFKHRDSKDLSEETKMIQNLIMARLGTPQNNFIVIALTNRVQDFDPAFISRFNNRIIEILPPVFEQRLEMIDMYHDKYLVNPIFKPKTSWMTMILGADEALAPIIDADALTPEHKREITQKTDGFSGRDINNFFMDIYSEAAATEDMRVTKAMVDSMLIEMVKNTQKYVVPQTLTKK